MMPSKPPKLSRKQIKEGLESVPIDTIILGAASSGQTKLTASQRAFAYQMALGKTKAESFRQSRPNGRKSKAKPATASRRGQELTSHSAIQAQIDAFRLALEAQQHNTPAALRALAIHKLTEHAINPDTPPAQQIKAAELLGKMTEVALFTERREVVTVSDSGAVRDKLLASIRLALSAQGAEDAEAVDVTASELMAELGAPDTERPELEELEEDGEALDDGQIPDPTSPLHSNSILYSASPMHSIPHTHPPLNSNQQGEGGNISQCEIKDVSRETPPLSNSVQSGGE
jgi:hypothetical protein